MYVELRNVNKKYGDFRASKDVSFSIEKGHLVGLLGPSGSGKTTILRMIAGLEIPDSGDIIIDGKVINDVPASQRGIGFVFQNYALFRYMTVYDNIAFGLKVQKKDKAYIKERVTELIELVGLKGMEKRYPSQLSGGQRQRVAFARALAPNPQVLLLDEPFAAIDAKVRHELRSWLKSMIQQLEITSIFVTHDQDEAIEVADEIIITNKGSIEQMGTPREVYENPETRFTASFFGNPSEIEDYDTFHCFDHIDNVDLAIVRPEFVKIEKMSQAKQSGKTAGSEDSEKVDTTKQAGKSAGSEDCEKVDTTKQIGKSAGSEDSEKVDTSKQAGKLVGVIEGNLFRGAWTDVKVRIGDDLIIARRELGQEHLEVGEVVSVYIEKLFVMVEERAIMLENQYSK